MSEQPPGPEPIEDPVSDAPPAPVPAAAGDPLTPLLPVQPSGPAAPVHVAPDLEDFYEEERESVVERVDRYADLVFEDDEDETPLERREHHVTLVVVAHNGARWLPPTIATVDRLHRDPDEIVAVDTGSTDATASLLTGWLGSAAVAQCDAGTGFGAAVAAGVQLADALAGPAPAVLHDEGWEGEDAPPSPRPAMPMDEDVVRWVWILHDDSAPAPTALQELLDASDTVRTAAVLGPKVLGWHDRRLLLETGVTISGSGRRVTGLERGELDQGQHDGLRDVLAVGSAGMLVRRDVWDALGGFDPEVPLFRDDVDFGWRANEAGYGVMVATEAEVHHAEAGSHGRRPLAAVPDHPRRADRAAAMHVLLAHASALMFIPVLLRLALGSLARTVGYLLAKAPEEASDELGALLSVLGHPGRLSASRRLVARTRTVRGRELAALRPRFGSQARHAIDAVVAFAGGTAGTAVATSGASAAGPSEDEAFDDTFDEGSGRLAFWVRRPALAVALLLAVVSLVSVRAWFGAGLLEGGALLPAPPGAGDLWSTYAQGWHEVGPGAATAAPPYLMVLWLMAGALLGNASRAVDTLLMVSVPVAAVVMYLALRRVVGSRLVRSIAAGAYALLPAAVAGAVSGRLGTLVFLVLLPALMRVGLRVPVSWRAAWGGALLLAVMTAFVPLAWLLSLVAVVLAVVFARGLPRLALDRVVADDEGARPDLAAGRRNVLDPGTAGTDTEIVPMSLRSSGVLLRMVTFLVAALVLLLPWSIDLLRSPARWLGQAGLPGPVDASLPAWKVALVNPGGPGSVPWWFTLGIVALGVGGLLRRRSRGVAVMAWALALMGLVVAVLQTLLRVAAPSEQLPELTWAGPATVVLGLGLIIAGAAAADGIGVRLARDSFSWRQPAAVVAIVAAVLAPLLTAGWWIWQGVGDTVTRGDGSAVPAFVAAESQGPDRPRSLVFRPGSRGIEYALIDGEGPRIGAAETGPPASAYDDLDGLVADLMAGRGGAEIDGLGRYGVRFVVLTAPSPELTSVLDSEPGLRRVSSSEGDTLWRLDTDSERVRVVGAKPPVVPISVGSVDGAVSVNGNLPKDTPAPSALLLAERADPSWHATLDGESLDVQADPTGWRQAFGVTAGTGTLRVWFDQEPRHRWLWLQGLVLVVVIVLALPARRREVDDPDADEVGMDEFEAQEVAP